jgi:tRNA-dihydrouridine synthase B
MKSAIKGQGDRTFGSVVSHPAVRPPSRYAPLSIGNLEVAGRWFLAPLAGVSDWPFRTLARAQGAPMAYTEMISSEGLARGGKNTLRMLDKGENEDPWAVQIFGSDPETMGRAAAAVEAHGARLVDVNMGCPVKKVCKTGSGSALLRDPRHVEAIVRAMVAKVSIPVQIKVRTGWDAHSVNVVEVAKAAEAAGASAIAIHGRTRAQAYEGHANWDLIAEVKQAVRDLKVIGNGDILTAHDALDRLERYGVDAVMIGRAACGYPWIFREIDALSRGEPLPPPPTYAEWRGAIFEHLENLVAYRDGSVDRAVREFRKHLVWYSRGRKGAGAFRGELTNLFTREDVEACLDRHFPEARHHEMGPGAILETGPLERAWG